MIFTGKQAKAEVREIKEKTDWPYFRIAKEANIRKDTLYRLMGGGIKNPNINTLKKIRKLHGKVMEAMA